MPLNDLDKQNLKALGEKLGSIRKAKGLTLKELAYAIGKEPQSVHRVEQGQINPTYLYILKLCEGLEISMSDILP